MSLEPAALPAWLAAGLVALVAAALVGLYRLRPPPRRVAVASNLLWRRAAAKPPPGRERLRWWLSLLVALAIGALLAAALAEPVRRGGERLAIVVDASPTMATRTRDGRTRFERALEEAARLAAQRGDSRVLVTSTCALDAAGISGGAREALATLPRLGVCPPDALRFPELATAGARRLLIGDGVWPLGLPDDVEPVSVFEPAANAGITGLAVARGTGSGERSLRVEVANGSERSQRALLELSRGGWRHETALRLAPDEVRALALPLPALAPGPLLASLRAEDDALPLDDRAWLWLGRPRLRVRLAGTDDRFLETALRLDPGVAVERVAAERWGAPGTHDALVFERAPPARPDRPFLAFGAGGGAGPAPGARVAAEDRGHPALRHVWLEDLEVRSAARLDEAEGEVLARANGAPVIVADSRPPRGVRVAFGLDASSWPSSPDFPVFVSAALAWAAGPGAVDTRLGLVEVPLAGATVRTSAGEPVVSQEGAGTTRFVARRPGLYAVSSGARTVHVAASLLDRRAAGVNRSDLPATPPASTPVAGAPGPDPPWRALVALATLLLAAEHWSYRRRLTL